MATGIIDDAWDYFFDDTQKYIRLEDPSFDIEKIYRLADRLCQASLSRSEPFITVTRIFYQIIELLFQNNKPLVMIIV